MKYKKLSAKQKREIQLRYEVGEDLIDLSIEFNANYDSLKNYAAIKKWKKNSKAEVIYAKTILDEQNKFSEAFKSRMTEYRLFMEDLFQDFRILCGKKTKTGKTSYTKNNLTSEKAIKNRIETLEMMFELDRKLNFFYTPKEQLEINKLALDFSIMKKEVEKETEAEQEQKRRENENSVISGKTADQRAARAAELREKFGGEF